MKPKQSEGSKKISAWVPILLLMFGLFFTMNSMLNNNVPYGLIGIAILVAAFYFVYRYLKQN